jgi:hypothetical protein
MLLTLSKTTVKLYKTVTFYKENFDIFLQNRLKKVTSKWKESLG